MKRNLTIVAVEPLGFCMAWHSRLDVDGPTVGSSCCWCEREIAVPLTHKDTHMACIYCGLDKGYLPAVEIEPCQWSDVKYMEFPA